MGGSYTGSDTEGAVNVHVTNGRPRRDVTLGPGQGQWVTPVTYGSHPRGHAGASRGTLICSTCPHTSHRQGPPIPEPRHGCQRFCSRNVFSACAPQVPGSLSPRGFLLTVCTSRLPNTLSLKTAHVGASPGGAVVENLPANAGDRGSSPGLGRSHMPWSSWAREPQLLSLRVWSLCSAMGEAAIVRGPRTAMKSGPRLPQLEKALVQKRRPDTAINK